MSQTNSLFNEEDIRTKVVTTWLANHGFGPTDIHLEQTFEVRLGRSILRVGDGHDPNIRPTSGVFRPRADILVRSIDGRNLMIVEVKSPREPLDDEVREQGISYARLLRKGGMAPFVVLTNGNETQIYDSLSGERIDLQSIPLNHPHVRAGFKFSVVDIELRAEALQSLISLSSENLLTFCQSQVSHRMRLLHSADPQSGKKYIPSLYIERQDAKEDLDRLLVGQSRVILLVGPPQVGKTNFLCHVVNERLQRGEPCLFYPAIGMQKGLLEEISEDFQWVLSDTSMPYHTADKLKRILHRGSQQMVIFIDGWNEANLAVAHAIDSQCERLACDRLRFVISTTHTAAERLLLDQAGNPSFVAEAASIGVNGVPLIALRPDLPDPNWSIVSLTRYTEEEYNKVYEKYAEVFNVAIPDEHQKGNDPFLIRIAMEVFQGQTLPLSLDEPHLLAQNIERKISRVVDLQNDVVHDLLLEAADEMFVSDAPLQNSLAMRRWGLPLTSGVPNGLFEAALLARVHNEQGLPAIDFYFGRERDFLVAYWLRDWPRQYRFHGETMITEMDTAAQTQVGTEALRWFLRQPQHQNILSHSALNMSLIRSSLVRRVILDSMWYLVINREIEDDQWVITTIKQAADDVDSLVKAGAAKLIAVIMEDHDELAKILRLDKDLIVGLLAIDEQYPLGKNSVGRVVLDAMQSFNWDLHPAQDEETTNLTDLLDHLLVHEMPAIRAAAAKVLGFLAPEHFFTLISARYGMLKSQAYLRNEYLGGVRLAIGELSERYHGSLCPGYLHSLRDDVEDQSALAEEYNRMFKVSLPVISLFTSEPCAKELLDLLGDLKPDQVWLDEHDLEILCSDEIPSIYQLAFTFEATDEEGIRPDSPRLS